MNPVEQIRSLKTLTYKEIRRFFRIWQQALIPSVITTMLYFVIFGTFIFASGILGLLASSFIFNIFSDTFQNQTPQQENLKKN